MYTLFFSFFCMLTVRRKRTAKVHISLRWESNMGYVSIKARFPLLLELALVSFAVCKDIEYPVQVS